MSSNLLLLTIAGLMIGLSQVVNKKISSSGHDSKTYTTVIMLVNAVISTPLLFYQFSLATSLSTWLLIICSILAFAFSTFFSFQAYKYADLSIVAIVQESSIIFIALIGILVFREKYDLLAYIGLFSIFVSSLILTYQHRRLHLNKGILFAFLVAITGALASVLDKAILNDFSPYTYVFVNNLLVSLVFAFNLKRLREAKELLTHHFPPILMTAILWNGAFLLVSIVLQQTDVSRTMPVFKSLGLITPVLIGIIFLGEKHQIREKLVAAILGTIGITLLYWN